MKKTGEPGPSENPPQMFGSFASPPVRRSVFLPGLILSFATFCLLYFALTHGGGPVQFGGSVSPETALIPAGAPPATGGEGDGSVEPGGPVFLKFERRPQRIVIGEKVWVRSRVLPGRHPLLISKPPDYDESRGRYPVVYLLAAQEHFLSSTGLVRLLAAQGRIPEMLVVGLPSLAAPAGRSEPEQRERFLLEELLPFIDGSYRSLERRTLAGEAQGARLALRLLVTRPDAFESYIAINPELSSGGWMAPSAGENAPGFRARLFLALTRQDGASAAAERLAQALSGAGRRGLRSTLQVYPAADGQSIVHRALDDGLTRLLPLPSSEE